jgi:hypothetical protein
MQMFKSAIGKGLGLSAGMAMLLSSTSALAAPQSQTLRLAQRDVVVDTDGRSPSTSPSPDSRYPDSSRYPTSRDTRFACQYVNNQYTVVYYPESRPGEAYPWAVPGTMGGGWSADVRCNTIADRLEAYRLEGLQEMRTDRKNGYNIICVTTERSSDCPSRIVLTVPSGQDPAVTRDRVFENLTVADSGQSTVGVNTFTGSGSGDRLLNDILGVSSRGSRNSVRNRSTSINLRPFLDPSDGGTGTGFRNGVRAKKPAAKPASASPANNRRLDPGRFR